MFKFCPNCATEIKEKINPKGFDDILGVQWVPIKKDSNFAFPGLMYPAVDALR
ncbi:MAG: hypothetical protein US86_C0001G0078 [Candidatus Daviesbacteria bacterium GW2011_GWA2_38_24]|uniref:Uncharacterized protein n=1 Tax=Candidatus Daviesbacteria bacterium GW2011_GWA2_38_24 TaxID=1618422 RepID=A0A0G0MQH0_9BACT|nr:MAG: hypothetical protein US86_C0001G0078 [Candidatus Daviesbacteria bacterium GW2011_GWA2_38_24]KKQ78958.1 MAG: hypothetical protein UT01_C0055G0008 [Candidatus Daviesbacteria bacterium GW2011_GWA1_38_7]